MKKIKHCKKKYNDLNEQNKALLESFTELTKKHDKLESAHEELSEKNKELNEKIQQSNDETVALNQMVTLHETEYKQLLAESDALKNNYQELIRNTIWKQQ